MKRINTGPNKRRFLPGAANPDPGCETVRVNLKRAFAALTLLVLLFAGAAAPAQQEQIASYPAFPPGYVSIKVFDRHSHYVGRILPEKRYWATLDQIPVFLQNAIIAIEDSRFYKHGGIDPRGIARALIKDVSKLKMAEGGSTITQQLVKNKYLSGQKTLERKFREGVLAIEYERKYTKKQILEMYLNEIYFGNGAWGIVQAARLYFDKYPRELTEAECALLAGVPKAPARYNPLGKPAVTRDRKNLVLKRMAELKMITARRERQLRARRIAVVQPAEAPWYMAHIRSKLAARYGGDIIERGGLEVKTAMDLKMQKLAEKVLHEGIERISPHLQGALLSMDLQTGDVLAVAGGRDFKQSPYNRAFFAKRQPGSSIKPLIYADALEKGITAGSIWNDEPVSWPAGDGQGSWTPHNYGNEHYGSLSLRQALAHSNNIVSVKLLETIGVAEFVRFASTLGLPLRPPGDLSLALGTDDVTLSDLVLAYAPLASGGVQPKIRTIISIYERDKNHWMDIPAEHRPVISPAAAYITTSMLKDVLVYGTAKSLHGFSRERPAAGKTGTTDDYRDAWFVGYTPQVITGVWAGYDIPRPMGPGFTGGAICAPIWGRFMRTATAGTPAVDFPRPESVVSVLIDPATGFLAAPGCPRKQEELYVAGTQPTAYCPKHGPPAPAAPPPAPELQQAP
jgi:1A family penicillin-binding protein